MTREHLCEIRSFVERDIDVWLAEELRVNSAFAEWFCGKASTADIVFPARTRISVMSENGETDVEAVFETKSGDKFALLVENKVRHSLSADQLGRYFRRGDRGVDRGLWKKYAVLVFAPSAKLARYEAILGGTAAVSFENAAKFLISLGDDARAAYRADFIARAALEERVEVEGADAFRVEFWSSLYDMVDREFPGYFALDRRRLPKTTFIAANCVDSPKYLRVDLKGHMGEVDLALKNGGVAGALVTFLEAQKPEGSRVAFNKGSIVLRISQLPKFEVADGFAREPRSSGV
ncbi:hypothetical protein ACVIGA_005168 [Bradyrhizobium sp. USDA 3240]